MTRIPLIFKEFQIETFILNIQYRRDFNSPFSSHFPSDIVSRDSPGRAAEAAGLVAESHDMTKQLATSWKASAAAS